jgi:AraC-like DNA-binding protein
MKLITQPKGEIQNDILNTMIHSWDYFDLDFPLGQSLSNAQFFVPNGFIELIFLKDLHVYEATINQPLKKLPQSFIWGQTKQGNQVAVIGKGVWIEIKIYPWAFELLFGHSANSLSSCATATRDITKALAPISEQINTVQNAAQVIHLFEQFAIQQLHTSRTVKPFLVHAFNSILSSHGQVQISALCNKMNVSRQYFHQYFKDKIGLSPKSYAKIIRLRKTVDNIYKNNDLSLTQIALEGGYFDQAHFIHDFKSILHQPPSAFFKQKQFIYWDL